jgi:hypothetical protein
MITWLQLFPMLLMPTYVLGALAALPTVQAFNHLLGGGPVREWLLNHCLLSWLAPPAGHTVIGWFAHATAIQEWLLALLIALNLNALCLPLLYAVGNGLIRVKNWFAIKNLELKRKNARR